MVAKHNDHVEFLSLPVVFLELFQARRNLRKSLMSLKCPVHREETMVHNEEKARRISTHHPHCSVHPAEPAESPTATNLPPTRGHHRYPCKHQVLWLRRTEFPREAL